MNLSAEKVSINGVDYVRADSVSVESKPTGNRCVVVVDRGWIFAGDVTRASGRITLTRAVWLRNWSDIGFDVYSPTRVLRSSSEMAEVPGGHTGI